MKDDEKDLVGYTFFMKKELFTIPLLSIREFKEFLLLNSTTETVEGELVYPPQVDDLYSLYTKIRNNNVVAILEFGSGWSTLTLAKALDENRLSHQMYVKENIRHPNPFALMTLDVSEKFQAVALNRIPSNLKETNIFSVTTQVHMATVNGQICHLYDFLPPFTADFIYLDGPDCDQVGGDVNGFSVNFESDSYSYGLPMAADLILMEPYFWPGTLIMIDGRGANANFLKNNFRRNWLYEYNKDLDQHSFQLVEEPVGRISESLLIHKKIRVELT